MGLLKEEVFEHNGRMYHLMLIKEFDAYRLDVFTGERLLFSSHVTGKTADDFRVSNDSFTYDKFFAATISGLRKLEWL